MPRSPLVIVTTLVLLLAATIPATAAQPYQVSFHEFSLAGGRFSGAMYAAGKVTLASSDLASGTYVDPFGGPATTYVSGTWTTAMPFSTPAPFSELVASWNADTPPGTWIEVRMRAHSDKGATKWYVMGRWTFDDGTIHRTSVRGQGDADGFIAVDTFFAKDHLMSEYELQVALFRATWTAASPALSFLGAVTSNAPNLNPYVPSAYGLSGRVELDVPAYSQEIHEGEYPQFDGGGEAWCSPTSTSMILAYWGRGPSPSDYAYVHGDYPKSSDPWVDYAARFTYDYRYQGAGNWPFNTAYAAHYGLRGFVTQLRSLNEAERFIAAGIPLVASIAFTSNKLDGFLFKSTGGHLLTIVGFDEKGNVISNDPASDSDATVRHVYDREQFEKAWLSSTGGIVYVIRPANVDLPPHVAGLPANW